MEKQPDIRIFIACHKPTYVPENPIFYPVQVGTALTEKRLEHMAYRDNEGDNISGKNPRYRSGTERGSMGLAKPQARRSNDAKLFKGKTAVSCHPYRAADLRCCRDSDGKANAA